MPPREFCLRVLEQAEESIAATILTALSAREVGPALARFMGQTLDNPLLDISIRLRPRIIGIGAAAPFLLPAVAERLGTEAVFPEHFEVGNALGAAIMDSINAEA
jgi:N-methylhydantoinase A/oxoprolinase/acetone carboxylase beta subunit